MTRWRSASASLLLLALAPACGGGKDAKEPKKTFAPMPDSGYRVEWGEPSVPCALKAGATVPVSVIVKNVGDQTWPDLRSSEGGRGAVRLGFRWWKVGDDKAPAMDYTGVRGDLKAPLSPQKDAVLTVKVVAPATGGSYMLQLDLVSEFVHWFQHQGAPTLVVPVTVS